MIGLVVMALGAGLLVGVSRQLNGRLALSTSALRASWWNHVVGFVALCLVGLLWGGLFSGDIAGVPLWAWLGGPAGVVFVAAGSWLIARIGAVATALFIIAGQMIMGVVVDAAMGLGGGGAGLVPRLLGVALIVAGMVVLRRRSPART